MRFREIFRFEVAYQARRAWPWLILVVLVVLSFLMTRDGTLAEALYEDFFVNSPFAVAKTTVVGGLAWLLMAAAVAGEAGARDVATGMHPLTWTAPVGKRAYLGGRFLAAFTINAVLLLAVQAGILLGIYAPGLDAAGALGPFRPAAFLTAYGFLALPTAFAATSIQFALATRKGRTLSAYMGSLLLLFMGFFVASLLLFRRRLGELLDPIGVRFVLDQMSHEWTTTEKSLRLIELEGAVLGNRLVWLGVGLAVLGLTYARFRFAHRAEGRERWWRRWRRPRRGKARVSDGARDGALQAATFAVPSVDRTFGLATHARQTLAIAGDSFRALVGSWAGRALLLFVPLLVIPVVIDQMVASGTPLTPTTGQVLKELTGPLTSGLSRWVILPLLLVFFAGELVWRERDGGLGEIAGAMPGSEWAPFLGKLLGLAAVLALFTALQMAAGMAAQAILGYTELQLGLYLGVLFGIQLPEYLLFALLALVIHAVVDHKYVGHLVAVLAYVFIAMAALFGVHHDLLIYGAGPWWSYTDMRGLGPYVGPWLAFKLYWAAWAVLLAVAARLFWVRGRESGVRARLRRARHRLTPATAGTAALGAVLVLALGGFVFYNTDVLNEYRSPDEIAERAAAYERRYGATADAPAPELIGANLRVEIHPDARRAEVRVTYRLVNREDVPIDTLHVAVVPGSRSGARSSVETGAMQLDRPVRSVEVDEDLGVRVYSLASPLRPGEAMSLAFRARLAPRGFREGGVEDAVVANGTHFTQEWLPAIGYQRSRELMTAGERREHGLPARPVIPSLYDPSARGEKGPGVAFEAIVGTDPDQVAVAPGKLLREWTEDGRRWFHYRTSAPIGTEWVFASARYAVHEESWEPPAGSDADSVAIRVLHHPGHSGHLDRTLRSVRASLDHYTETYGPYPYDHLTFAEVPGDGVGLHADPGIITHGEGITLLKPREGPGSHDLPFYVVAHEMAHQWAIPAAYVEGAPVIAEGIATYQGMRLVEKALGPEQLRRQLRFMRRPYPYPAIRRGEPLLRGLDPYLSYRKGPFALYALSEHIGKERVDEVLRRLLERHRTEGAPLATMLDVYRELEAVTPEEHRSLLHDLFRVTTVWDLETERASAEATATGEWRVTFDVRARKLAYDEAGEETEVPMDDPVRIGVFAAVPRGRDKLSKPLLVETRRLSSGERTITVTVPERPALAGVDPYRLLDWEEIDQDDNVEPVRIDG